MTATALPLTLRDRSLQLRDILIGKADRNDSERVSVTSGSFDTPMSHNSHESEDGYDKLKDLELAVKAELAGHMYRDENFEKNAFVGQVASEKDIEEFFLGCDLYDNDASRWRDIPEKPVYESELYDPIGDILEAAIDHFYPSFDSNPPTRLLMLLNFTTVSVPKTDVEAKARQIS